MSNKLKVIMVPNEHEYVKRLKKSLEKEEIKIYLFDPFWRMTPINFTKMFILRIRGYQIIHVHWLHVFKYSFIMNI